MRLILCTGIRPSIGTENPIPVERAADPLHRAGIDVEPLAILRTPSVA